MTYEFNPRDANNAIENPFKVENIFLLFSAFSLFFGGYLVAKAARELGLEHHKNLMLAAIAMSLVLFGTGVRFTVQSLSHLRLFLGRSFPNGLASELPENRRGAGEGTNKLLSALKHKAIDFEEPEGPLSGILYSFVKDLICAPQLLQNAAVQQFHGLVGMMVLFGSLCVSYSMFHGNEFEGVVSWIYLPMSGLSLITPFMQNNNLDDGAPNSHAMLWQFMGLIVFSIVAPVLVPMYLPAVDIPAMWIAPASLMIASSIASAMFLIAVILQLETPKNTDVSCAQVTLGMNCQPSQLWTEINREFQNNWSNQIPNRPYANVPPDVTGESRGSFLGYILEETQPHVTNTMAYKSWSEFFGSSHNIFVLLLTVWGFITACAASAYGAESVKEFGDYSKYEISRAILVVIAFTVASGLSFRLSHLLWSKMHFKSRLIWIETNGTYQQSELSVGNQFTGQAKSTSILTRVEDATLRVWSADLVTVGFNKEAGRSIIGMTSVDGFAHALSQRLVDFGLQQSGVATPTNQLDLSKALAITRMSNALSNDGNVTQQSQSRIATGTHSGTVRFFNVSKGFGFITADNGADHYFSGKECANKSSIAAGVKVAFNSASSPRGAFATNIEKV